MAWIAPAIMAGSALYGAYNSSKGSSSKSHGSHGSFWGGSDPYLQKYETMTHGEKSKYKDLLKRINPKSVDIQNSPLFQQASKYYQGILGGDTGAFEKPLMSQFQQEIAPGIAERYAGAGAMNSSGFQQAMGAAGSNLTERLGMLRAQLQSGAAGNLANMSQMQTGNMMNLIQQLFSTPSFGYANMAGQPGFGQGLAPGIGQGIGSYGTMKALQVLGGWGGGGGGDNTTVGS